MTDRNRIFYEVEGKKFARNIEAFFYLKEIRKNFPKAKPKFILDFDFLTNPQKHSWKTEPPASLNHYIDMYVSILHQQYRKVFIFYSGGTDTHPILESFARQKFPVTACYVSDEPMGITEQPVDCFNQNASFGRDWAVYGSGWYRDYTQFVTDLSFYAEANRHKGKGSLITTTPFMWLTNKPSPKEIEKHLTDSLMPTHSILTANYSVPTSPDKSLDSLISETDCIIFGLEKPIITIHKGWYCHSMPDSYFLDYAPYKADLKYFYFSDPVPELHIKLTWLRLNAIEHILDRDKIPKTSKHVANLQSSGSKYYYEINRMAGQFGLNYLEDQYKTGRDISTAIGRETTRVDTHKMQFMNDALKEFWLKSVIPNVENRFLNYGNETIMSITTPLIKLKPVNV